MYFSAWAVRKNPTTKRAETGIEPGSRDPEPNVVDRSTMVATRIIMLYLIEKSYASAFNANKENLLVASYASKAMKTTSIDTLNKLYGAEKRNGARRTES